MKKNGFNGYAYDFSVDQVHKQEFFRAGEFFWN